MITPYDLKDDSLKSGFKKVGFFQSAPPGKQYHGQVYGGKNNKAGHAWQGPPRATAIEAAQDVCDYLNGNGVTIPVQLKSAGHPTKQRESKVREAIEKVTGDNKTKKGYVYLIAEEGNTGMVKIGESKDHPKYRLAGLQTGNPRKLVVLGVIKTNDRKKLEKELHAKFVRSNILAEWFWMSTEIRKEFGIR